MKGFKKRLFSAAFLLIIMLALIPMSNLTVYALESLDDMGSHEHGSWEYTAEGATLTAECKAGGDCTLSDNKVSLSLVIIAESQDYLDTGFKGPYFEGLDAWKAAGLDKPSIHYEGREGTYYQATDAPTKAGKYVAKITVEGQTASLYFEYTYRAWDEIKDIIKGTYEYFPYKYIIGDDPGEILYYDGDRLFCTYGIVEGTISKADDEIKFEVWKEYTYTLIFTISNGKVTNLCDVYYTNYRDFTPVPEPDPEPEPVMPSDNPGDKKDEWLKNVEQLDCSYVINLAVREKYSLDELKKEKADGKNYKISYLEKSDSEVATMTAKGLLTAKKAGVSHIILNKSEVEYKITVNVFDPQFKYENSSQKYFTVNVGSTVTPTYDACKLKPTFTLDKNATKKKLATINPETGEVTPLKKGSVKVMATVGEGKMARTITTIVKIYDPVINTGKTTTVMVEKVIKASVKNGVKTTTDWKSSNEAIAVVDSKGIIKGVSAGKVTISCINNGKTISKEIKVIDNPTLKK